MDFSGIVPALPSLWEGMLMTLKLMVLGVLGGVALGTVLALMRLSHSKLLSNIAGFYVNYFRSIPLLLVITWFYFAVPFILRWITGEDTPVGAFTSCLVAFMMFEAAYYCEIVRAGSRLVVHVDGGFLYPTFELISPTWDDTEALAERIAQARIEAIDAYQPVEDDLARLQQRHEPV